MLFGAVRWHAAVGAGEGEVRGVGVRVRGVWAVGVGFDVSGFLTHRRRGGFVHGVEEVSGFEEDSRVL